MRVERGALGEVALHRGTRVAGGEDGKAGDKRAQLARRSIEILRGKMEPRQRRASRARVNRTAEVSPGDCVVIKINARRNFVYLVSPLARFNGRLAGSRSKNPRDRHTMCKQMRQKAMLLEKPLAIAHRAMMALDEDALLRSVVASRGHDRGG